jgi:hypothetical protein
MGFLIATQVIGDGALTVYLVNETTLRQRLLPPEALGRAAATWQFAAGLLTPVGALTGAALAQTLGMRPTLWVLAFALPSPRRRSPPCAARCPAPTRARMAAADSRMPCRLLARFPPRCATSRRVSRDRPTSLRSPKVRCQSRKRERS